VVKMRVAARPNMVAAETTGSMRSTQKLLWIAPVYPMRR